MSASKIEWTQETWNPTTGCDRVSPGCDNCYALTLARRLKGMGQAKYQRDGDPRTSGPGFGLTVHPDTLDQPLRWRTPRRVFVNSMSDLFHLDVPDEFIEGVLCTMNVARQHTYQVLTKRPQRMAKLLQRVSWDINGDLSIGRYTGTELGEDTERSDWYNVGAHLPHVWWGTSIESDRYAWRADRLRETPAAVRFLSLEPLLTPLPSLDLTGIGWVIVGGESGPGARRMNLEWADDIVARCRAANVPVFVKQLGSAWCQPGDSKGGDPRYWPPELRVREMPESPVEVTP